MSYNNRYTINSQEADPRKNNSFRTNDTRSRSRSQYKEDQRPKNFKIPEQFNPVRFELNFDSSDDDSDMSIERFETNESDYEEDLRLFQELDRVDHLLHEMDKCLKYKDLMLEGEVRFKFFNMKFSYFLKVFHTCQF